MSNYNNYEQILCEWLANFVDKDKDGYSLVFRNTAPTIEEIEKLVWNFKLTMFLTNEFFSRKIRTSSRA